MEQKITVRFITFALTLVTIFLFPITYRFGSIQFTLYDTFQLLITTISQISPVFLTYAYIIIGTFILLIISGSVSLLLNKLVILNISLSLLSVLFVLGMTLTINEVYAGVYGFGYYLLLILSIITLLNPVRDYLKNKQPISNSTQPS